MNKSTSQWQGHCCEFVLECSNALFTGIPHLRLCMYCLLRLKIGLIVGWEMRLIAIAIPDKYFDSVNWVFSEFFRLFFHSFSSFLQMQFMYMCAVFFVALRCRRIVFSMYEHFFFFLSSTWILFGRLFRLLSYNEDAGIARFSPQCNSNASQTQSAHPKEIDSICSTNRNICAPCAQIVRPTWYKVIANGRAGAHSHERR